MTHEPECLEVGYELDPSEFCSICITARAAYQRGREDAAQSILNGVSHANDCYPIRYGHGSCDCGVGLCVSFARADDPFAAARGDGAE